MVRVGIIGYGKMGILHGALVNGTGKAKVTAICDKSFIMRFGIKRVYTGVKTYSDVGDMLDKTKLDVVIISTPTFNHAESAVRCLEKNCDLFIEKPLAVSFRDAAQLYGMACRKGKKIQVGFANRFACSISKGKQLLDAGTIGEPQRAKAYMYIADVLKPHSGWRYDRKASGGGVLMDFGIHMLDQLCWYFGRIDTVQAESKRLYSVDVEDELSADIVFQNGVSVEFSTSWSRPEYRKSYARLEITGSQGNMIVTDQTLDITDAAGKHLSEYVYPDLYDGAFLDVGGLWFSKQMEYFFQVLENKAESNLKDAVYVQMVIEKIYESADRRVKVKIKNDEFERTVRC